MEHNYRSNLATQFYIKNLMSKLEVPVFILSMAWMAWFIATHLSAVNLPAVYTIILN